MDCDLHAGGEKMEKINIQDKVNYAVSEMEDRVTDVTTIKGLRAVLECTGLYLTVLGCTGLY